MELDRVARQGQEVRDEVRASQRNSLLPASAGGVHDDSPAFELWQVSGSASWDFDSIICVHPYLHNLYNLYTTTSCGEKCSTVRSTNSPWTAV